ncbi:hypothetical protein ASPFODRAFT_48230, partial [Aspergillus luchuensis CBS 106.47]
MQESHSQPLLGGAVRAETMALSIPSVSELPRTDSYKIPQIAYWLRLLVPKASTVRKDLQERPHGHCFFECWISRRAWPRAMCDSRRLTVRTASAAYADRESQSFDKTQIQMGSSVNLRSWIVVRL